jgi:hypothetical protein
MGNRGGRLHDAERRLGPRRWTNRRWISCRLAFRGRRREVMGPNGYTELFFLDDLVALAAGHRPCGECRRDALARFRAHWPEPAASLAAIDAALHRARVGPRPTLRPDGLPDGTFVRDRAGSIHLVSRGRLHRFAFAGYGPPEPAVGPAFEVLTPEPVVALLRTGHRPEVLHPSLDVRG